jgi:ABC-type proline/glycine betaine transport system substrate-binding protein
MNWKRILKDMGYSPTEDQIQQWIDEGKKDAKKFVKKWINRKRDEI